MNKNSYNAIVAEVEKMAILVMNNDNVKKVKYVNVGDRKFRVTFWWDAGLNESEVKVEEKKYGYEEFFVWNSTKTTKTFPDALMDYTKESIKQMVGYKKGTIVEVEEVENLEMGKAKQCHFNSAVYAIENDCNFVCGWFYSNGYPIPHCINEKDGKYFDTTLNRNGKFKIYHTYTAEEIQAIYDEVGVSFIPFETVYSDAQEDFYIFDGNERVTTDRYNNFMDYINKMRWTA